MFVEEAIEFRHRLEVIFWDDVGWVAVRGWALFGPVNVLTEGEANDAVTCGEGVALGVEASGGYGNVQEVAGFIVVVNVFVVEGIAVAGSVNASVAVGGVIDVGGGDEEEAVKVEAYGDEGDAIESLGVGVTLFIPVCFCVTHILARLLEEIP